MTYTKRLESRLQFHVASDVELYITHAPISRQAAVYIRASGLSQTLSSLKIFTHKILRSLSYDVIAGVNDTDMSCDAIKPNNCNILQ